MPRSKSLLGFSLLSILMLAIGAFLHFIWTKPPVEPSDPDDRPPIIVSGGSVDIGVDPKSDEKGEMKPGLFGATWYHAHYNDPPDHFQLIFDNATCTSSGATPVMLLTKELVVTYKAGASTTMDTFTISLAFFGHDLTIDHGSKFKRVGPNGKPKNHYQLTMADATLQSAAFTSLDGFNYTCSLADLKAAIHILQVRQAQ